MILLASASPRRRRLLKEAGLHFRVVKPSYHEKRIAGASPERLTRTHAVGKAASVARHVQDGTILAADTVVAFRGRILGKPKSLSGARRMLGALCGHWHRVVTGVALVQVRKGKAVRRKVFTQSTRVFLKDLPGKKLDAYLRRIRPLDKAGSYAIQSRRDCRVGDWKGSFTNAVGLPMEELKKALRVLR